MSTSYTRLLTMSTLEPKDFWEARFDRLYDSHVTRWTAMTWRAYLEAYPDCDSASRRNAENMVADYAEKEVKQYGRELAESDFE